MSRLFRSGYLEMDTTQRGQQTKTNVIEIF